ncbi:MAG TPA: signal peptidase II, partial [Acidimicrobiia bacterium]|nr:signal peptidase II [Acidimicrobiia bacterium]
MDFGRNAGVLVAATVIAVDQWTKLLASSDASLHNANYAFGIVRGATPVLVAGTVSVLLLFVGVVGRIATRLGIPVVLPAFVAGGMVSNAIDRVVFGSVRDHIVTPWAIVNVADV